MSANRYPSTPDPVRPHQPHRETWSYHVNDFSRHDESSDTSFYSQPRFVAHIDEAAVARLRAYYSQVVPTSGSVLDLCTSWNSWYGAQHETAVNIDRTLKVFGIGMNKAELAANHLFMNFPNRRTATDLNAGSWYDSVQWTSGDGESMKPMFDCVTCTVSVDYLAQPLKILRSIRENTKEGGHIHLAVSNRCFPTKVVRIWLDASTDERLQLVGDYLHFSGWEDVEVVDLCARDVGGKRITDDDGTLLKTAGSSSSVGHLDPLWVVRGVKEMKS